MPTAPALTTGPTGSASCTGPCHRSWPPCSTRRPCRCVGRRVPTGSGLGVGALGRRRPLRTDRTRLLTGHHIHEATAVAAVGQLAVEFLDLLAVPARPGQPPPPSGDPGPQAAPHHDDHGSPTQPGQPPPPTSTPRPPAAPGHDHHVLPLHRLQAASIARRQKAAYPRPRRCPSWSGESSDEIPSGFPPRTLSRHGQAAPAARAPEASLIPAAQIARVRLHDR